MVYNTPEEVRVVCGIDLEDAPDWKLEDQITKADNLVIRSLGIQRENEKMVGSQDNITISPILDGHNRIFYTQNHPLADIDADTVVSTSEVTVWVWTTSNDSSIGFEAVRAQATVSSIDASRGRIELASAPSNLTIKITCDYWFYLNEMDFVLVKYAAALATGMIWAQSEYFFIPDSSTIGPIHVAFIPRFGKGPKGLPAERTGGLPYERIAKEYLKIMHTLRMKPIVRSKYVNKQRIQDIFQQTYG